MDLNCPPHIRSDAPSPICSKPISGTTDIEINMETYRERLNFLRTKGLKIFIGYKDINLELPDNWIDKKFRDSKSGEIFYLLNSY